MARKGDYYKVSFRRNDKQKRNFSLLNIIMGIITVAIALALLLAYIGQWINPAHGASGISFLPLVMPLLLLGNLVMLLFWILRWRAMAFLPLAIAVLGIGATGLFFKPTLTKDYGQQDINADVKVMTYNVMGMNNRVNNRLISSLGQISEAIDSVRPDILCIQEFQSTRTASRKRFDSHISWLNYSRVRYKIDTGQDYGWGIATYSRYPIANCGYIDFEGVTNSAMWCDVVIRRDTIRVFNAHLQSTSISDADQDFISNMEFVSDTTRNEKFKNIFHKLKLNYTIRAIQADSVKAAIERSPYKVIVCGDFNDTPLSYTYHRMRSGLNDSFKKAGHGAAYTFKGFFNLLRIDYVLYSDELKAVQYDSPYFESSDHKPVVVTFAI